MPWEHCGQTVADDADCPACGLSKEQWSIKFDATRTFQLSRKPKAMLNLELVDAEGEPVFSEGYRAVLPDGKPHDAATDEEGRSIVGCAAGNYTVSFPKIARSQLVAPEGAEPLPEGGFRCPTGRKQRFELEGIFLDFDVEAEDEHREVVGIPWVLDTPDGLDDGKLDERKRVRVFCPPDWVDKKVTLELFSGPLVEVTFEVQAQDRWRDVVGVPYTLELPGGKKREGIIDESHVVKAKVREGQERDVALTLHLSQVVTTFLVTSHGSARVAGLPFTATLPDGTTQTGKVPADGRVRVLTKRGEDASRVTLDLELPDGHVILRGGDHHEGDGEEPGPPLVALEAGLGCKGDA